MILVPIIDQEDVTPGSLIAAVVDDTALLRIGEAGSQNQAEQERWG